MQVFGSVAHGGVPSALRTGAWSRCHHDSPHRALPHSLPRQNGASHPEPVSLLHSHASAHVAVKSSRSTASCMQLLLTGKTYHLAGPVGHAESKGFFLHSLAVLVAAFMPFLF